MQRASAFVAFTLVAGLTVLAAPPNRSGSLDKTFGTRGLVTTDFGGGAVDVGYAVAIEPIDSTTKTVAVGYTCTSGGSCPFALARYNQDGSLDTAFGMNANGLVIKSFTASEMDAATAVAVDSSGRIYIAGSTCPASSPSHCEFALARYNSDGTPDSNFGSRGDGWVITDVGGTNGGAEGEAIAIDSTTFNIAVAGQTTCSSTCSSEFAVATYDTSGMPLITAFTDFGSSSSVAVGVAFDSTGNIIAAGTYVDGSGTNQIGLACYQSDGSLCTTFGNDLQNNPGLVTTSLPGVGSASAGGMEIGAKGIVVAGTSNGGFVLARYTPTGALDVSFNATGVVTTSFGRSGAVSGNAVAESSSGEIVVVGNSDSDFAVAAYSSVDGSLTWTTTTTFGHGKGTFARATGVAIDSAGNATAVGYTNATGDYDFALARYLP
jgi:uncharacterized delta-60 repeat protein